MLWPDLRWARLAARRTVLVLAVLCLALLWIGASKPGLLPNPALTAGATAAGIGLFSAAAFLFGLIFLCSHAFAGEREHGLLELMLLTDLTLEAMIFGKLAAAVRVLWPLAAVALAGCLAAAAIGTVWPVLGAGILLDYPLMCAAYALLSVTFGIRYNRTGVMALCLSIFALWHVLGRALFVLLLPGIGLTAAGFLVDGAFHVELILVSSIYLEQGLKTTAPADLGARRGA